MELGKQFLSDLKLYSDYLKWREEDERFETWDEACENIVDGHRKKYENVTEIDKELDFALSYMKNKTVLASQRSLQYRAPQIERNNARMYNCSSLYAARNRIFQEVFFLGLSGCGVGIGLLKPFVANLSRIQKRTKGTKTFFINDSIENWADALGVLMSSYFVDKQPFPQYAGYEIKFDYSLIREKGSFISGGFKAPGPDGLKQSLEKIETLIENWLNTEGEVIRPILVFDILCHSADAVLAGGVRRSALNMIVDSTDDEMIYAKTGNWRSTHPHRGRSNNSVLFLRKQTTKEEFEKIVRLNDGGSDIGFAFANSYFDMFNPCFEILKIPILFKGDLESITYQELPEFIKTHEDLMGVQVCNLTEINAEACITIDQFYKACRAATILGTVQAGYTKFPYLGEITQKIVEREALIGVSITGLMNNPSLLSKEILKEGARIVKETNKEIASLIGINQAARTSTIKPSGNASVVLGTASGIHPEHSEKYFRIMQLNKENDTAKWLNENMPQLLEESYWSNTNSDYVVYVPIQNPKEGLFKKDIKGVKHLEYIKLVQKYWVAEGTNRELCAYPNVNHNVSCTVIVDHKQDVIDYIWNNKSDFTAASFISDYGDKEFIQAPFTSVSSLSEIISTYGKGALFASGLIVDGLHYFNNNLWIACETIKDKSIPITGTREQVMLKKYWLDRSKKFANNFFDGDITQMIYCLKDVHLLHKWELVVRNFEEVDFGSILRKPVFKSVSDFAATACSGSQCEITRI